MNGSPQHYHGDAKNAGDRPARTNATENSGTHIPLHTAHRLSTPPPAD